MNANSGLQDDFETAFAESRTPNFATIKVGVGKINQAVYNNTSGSINNSPRLTMQEY